MQWMNWLYGGGTNSYRSCLLFDGVLEVYCVGEYKVGFQDVALSLSIASLQRHFL